MNTLKRTDLLLDHSGMGGKIFQKLVYGKRGGLKPYGHLQTSRIKAWKTLKKPCEMKLL